jgi:hypothetical protein
MLGRLFVAVQQDRGIAVPKRSFKKPGYSGHFIQVSSALLRCPAYRVLGPSSKALFFDLRTHYKGHNNGDISAAMSDLVHQGWTSPTTLTTALYELQALGFLVKTRSGGIARGRTACNLFRFTDVDSPPHPEKGIYAAKATRDYLQYETIEAATAALKSGVAQLRAAARGRSYPKKMQLQNL